jgi:hypothetical protein
MKLGIVLPSYLYNEERKRLAGNAFVSLARTDSLPQTSTLLLLVRRGTSQSYTVPMEMLQKKFHVILKTDEGLEGTEQTLAFGTTWLFENRDVDYVTWMGDDALFNPLWLWRLDGLIKRHPKAVSWSVYRSAFEFVHRTIQETEEDVMVRSICGHGLTFSKKEWTEWGIDWTKRGWNCHQGDTLDLVHSEERSGERWVTKQSYVNHMGKVGVHCTPDIPEYAKDFQPA